ncbi:MAG: hypothetical protein KGZ37_02320 [Nitrosarchaeum sp.]|nr:hypothetical protein [Nitrosarchaeum sp.]
MSTIAVRAYTEQSNPKNNVPRTYPIHDFDRVLVFDTETTSNTYQNLKFGYFEVYQNNIREIGALFYDVNTISAFEMQILTDYSKQHEVKLISIEEFRKIFLTEVYELQTLCIGFNLPFDLKRIVLGISPGRKNRRNGFSLELSKDLKYPRLHITHVSNALSFIGWGSTKNKSKNFRGNFVDLRTLTNALTDKKFTLESACKAFSTKYQKLKISSHGKITSKYIEYCIGDVKATYSLYLNAKKEFEEYNLNIPITKAYTPATIGKQLLKKMNIKSFSETNKDFANEMKGKIMTCYLGGRTECKVRKTPIQVDALDFLSMYPTVCTLQHLWSFVIAKNIRYVDATIEVQEFLDSVSLEDLQNPKTWPKLIGIATIQPQNDILPIRSKFGKKYAWNIGMPIVSCKKSLNYSISDLVASKLLSGKTPKILEAYKFIAEGVQSGLKEIEIFGIKINPYKQDFFKELIQYRQQLKDKRDSFPKSDTNYSYYDRLQQIIKIIANATSYGIFVEINTSDVIEPVPIDVYGLEQFTIKKTKVEESGFMLNPIIGVSITSASRLLLATTEALLANHDTTHAYCDTDSMFVPPKHTKEIQKFFSKLNPYNFEQEIFKLEHHNIWFYGISAKRYCLYSFDKNGDIVIEDDDYSAHGLGHLLDPFKNKSDEKSLWHKEVWYDILKLHYGMISRGDLVLKYENKYAIQQLSISTPSVFSRFKKINKGKKFYSQIKPGNFVLIGFPRKTSIITGEPIKPFAAYQNPAKLAVSEEFMDYNDSTQKYKGTQYWETIWDTIEKYLVHEESKFEGDIGILQRKHIEVSNVVHIGKESNELEETELDTTSYEIYENKDEIEQKFRELIPEILKLEPKEVKSFGISRQTLWNVKNYLQEGCLNKISLMVKMKILNCFV